MRVRVSLRSKERTALIDKTAIGQEGNRGTEKSDDLLKIT